MARLPRSEDAEVFDPLVDLADGVLAVDLETGLGAILIFGSADLLSAGLAAGFPVPKSKDGLSDLSAGLGAGFPAPKSNDGFVDLSAGLESVVPVPKSKDGLSDFSVGFGGC